MKELKYIIAFVSAACLVLGQAFVWLKISVGWDVFNVGYLGSFLVALPLYGYSKLRSDGVVKWSGILAIVSSLIIGMSGLFKLLHLPGASKMLLVGAVLFAIGFLPLYFLGKYRG